jgi:NitT/TauT family transport system ATP-binding protein
MEEAVLLGDRVALMCSRPGRIVERIDVPLPRPRAATVDDIEGSAEFARITSGLWHRLRDMQQDRPTPQNSGSEIPAA